MRLRIGPIRCGPRRRRRVAGALVLVLFLHATQRTAARRSAWTSSPGSRRVAPARVTLESRPPTRPSHGPRTRERGGGVPPHPPSHPPAASRLASRRPPTPPTLRRASVACTPKAHAHGTGTWPVLLVSVSSRGDGHAFVRARQWRKAENGSGRVASFPGDARPASGKASQCLWICDLRFASAWRLGRLDAQASAPRHRRPANR